MPGSVNFQHYEVLTREDGSLHELGRGAMGITYKAFDTRLRIPVALKVVNAAHLHSENARQRFVREARAAAQLRHRNVASVFRLGEEGGNYFYVMEFIDGETVEALVKRQGSLSTPLALRMAAQVARALNAAQSHDLVHRDIKPSNLMAVMEDDDLVIKVIDFGLAKAAIAEPDSSGAGLTQGMLGTPHFASPEQLNEEESDTRSDIYSLGVTLWYMLLGRTPFTGSLARVVSQQISKPPPFEDLDAFPSTVVELLRRMLAKNPAERPQSAAELRKEIDKSLKVLVAADRTAPGSAFATEASATVPPPSSAPAPSSSEIASAAFDSHDIRLETGTTVAHRYLITHDLGESEAGTAFVARDLQLVREVRLLALHPELMADAESLARIERETAMLAASPHPGMLEIFEFLRTGPFVFLVFGNFHGFTLRQVLRARRELPPEEVFRLLEPAAAALDHAIAQLPRLEAGLHHVLIHFPDYEVEPDALLPRPVSEWPEFVVRINPLATWRDLFLSTWTAGQTLAGGAAHHERKSIDGLPGAIHALGTIAYELLGGVASPTGARDYSPLAALDEHGNMLLRRSLLAPESFPTATDFIQQFSIPASPAPVPAPDLRPDGENPDPAQTLAESSSPEEYATLPLGSQWASPRSHATRRVLFGVMALLVATGAWVGIQHWRHRTPAPLLVRSTPAPTPIGTVQPSTPAPTSPPSATPRPTTPAPPTSTPAPPTRLDLASDSRRAAEALEAKQQPREAISAWLRMARDFPEFDTARVGLELLLTRLRQKPGSLKPTEFAAMQPEIRQAAKLGVHAAMMVLGDQLRASDPKQAFAWYCAAAEAGDPAAMTLAGLMLSNGAGTPKDLRKAAAYFQMASDKGEAGASAVLAECYLEGKGVPENKKQAIALLQRASDRGNMYALNRLGWCYHRGVGVASDYKEALRLFTKAADIGSAEAVGNLGVLYLKGEGVPKSETKAVEKFKEASAKGDVNAMFYYARCLEGGLGVKANSEMAKKWFQTAASEGHPEAITWCKEHGAPIKAKGP